MSDIIPLNRRFITWSTEESRDAEAQFYLSEVRDTLDWNDLRQRRRVVILAEPGSGKSAEIDAQVERSRTADHYTFSATVQTVGRIGLERALGAQGWRELQAWRQSDQPAWFFFDAVDEAKADNVPFDDALREIAIGIEGCRARAFIVLTGRETNWEIQRDLDRLLKHLALPPPDLPPPALDPNDLVVAVIRQERQDDDEQAACPPIGLWRDIKTRSGCWCSNS